MVWLGCPGPSTNLVRVDPRQTNELMLLRALHFDGSRDALSPWPVQPRPTFVLSTNEHAFKYCTHQGKRGARTEHLANPHFPLAQTALWHSLSYPFLSRLAILPPSSVGATPASTSFQLPSVKAAYISTACSAGGGAGAPFSSPSYSS